MTVGPAAGKGSRPRGSERLHANLKTSLAHGRDLAKDVYLAATPILIGILAACTAAIAAKDGDLSFESILIIGGVSAGTAAALVIPLLQMVRRERQSSRADRQTLDHLTHALQSSALAVWDLDLETGHMSGTNSFHTMLGHDNALHPLDLDWVLERVDAKDRDRLFAVIEAHALNAIPFDESCTFRRENGQRLGLRFRGAGQFDRSDRLIRILGTLEHITKQKEPLEMVEAKQVATAQSDRARADYLLDLSRDLSIPAAGILKEAERLSETDLSQTQSGLIASIQDTGSVLVSVLKDMQNITQPDRSANSIVTDAFSPRNLIGLVESWWRPTAETSGLTIQFETDESVPGRLRGDRNRLCLAVLGLIRRAAELGPAGPIRVDLTCVGQTSHTAHLRCTVTAHATQAVSGIDLVAVRQSIEAMNGAVTLDTSTPERIAASIDIPLELADTETASPSPHKDRIPKDRKDENTTERRRLNVLVVDDHRINQKIMSTLLLQAGYDVDIAETGKEAVERVEASAYDLILMDIQMPVMDGITATAHIRAMEGNAAHTPIIAVTANAMQGDRETYLQSGMDGYVPKPVDTTLLFDTISQVMDFETRPQTPDEPAAPTGGKASAAAGQDDDALRDLINSL